MNCIVIHERTLHEKITVQKNSINILFYLLFVITLIHPFI